MKISRILAAAVLAVVAFVSVSVDGANRLSTRGGRAASGADPYTHHTAFDKALVPWHTAAGAWGARYIIQEAAVPVTSTSVTATTCANFTTAATAGARVITIETGTTIDCDNATVGPTIADIDVVIQSGAVLRSVVFGAFFGTPSINRVRLRSPTAGTLGGKIHNIDFEAQPTGANAINDIIIQDLDITGPGTGGGDAQNAIKIAGDGARFAIHRNRIASGCEGYIGNIRDVIAVANTAITALENPEPGTGQDEAWVFRLSSAAGGNIFYLNDFRASVPGRSDVYHRIRAHPLTQGAGHLWVGYNIFVDRVESRILWVDANASSNTGWFLSFITVGNETWATGEGANWYSESALYVSHTNNTFHSNTFTADANLTVATDVNGAGEGYSPASGLTATVVRSGNTYGALTSDPAWSSPGDPSGLTWDIGL